MSGNFSKDKNKIGFLCDTGGGNDGGAEGGTKYFLYGENRSDTAGYPSRGENDTKKLAKKLGAGFKGGETVLLSGDLGAGKTVFAKGIAEGMGIKEVVTSPTYTYLNIYENGGLTLYHYDLYRLKTSDEALELGLTDYLNVGGVCVIEWADIILPFINGRVIFVDIEKTSDKRRKITIESKRM
jgi:tRNA threonylcarbamoyladenosine biosynthesis protein TsaE